MTHVFALTLKSCLSFNTLKISILGTVVRVFDPFRFAEILFIVAAVDYSESKDRIACVCAHGINVEKSRIASHCYVVDRFSSESCSLTISRCATKISKGVLC